MDIASHKATIFVLKIAAFAFERAYFRLQH